MAFPWERLDPALPVVLCSLGATQALSPSGYVQFFRCVVAAFEPFADRYQLVISTNGKVPAEALGDAYHVVAVPEFPQMALLRRAAVMITHGGANSVRECLTLGVPMLLYPLGFDQFGHPARAVWRGAGLRIRRVEVASLRDGLTRILTHSCYRLQALRISHEFQVAEETQPAAKCIEAFLPRRAETLSRREMRHDAGTPVPA